MSVGANPDPAFQAATAPGTEFEIAERGGLRQFVKAPPNLDQMVEDARQFGERTCVIDFDPHGDERSFTFAEFFAWRDGLVTDLGIRRATASPFA